MKDRIKEKIRLHIEYILSKDVLSKDDYETLCGYLFQIEQDESKEEREEKYKKIVESIATLSHI
jgi:hypothetical protein